MQVINTERIPIKKCACGCEREISPTDRYGRSHIYISGHNGRRYENKTQYKREWNYRNRGYRLVAKVERGHKLKKRVVELLGGKCEACGLSYNGRNACVFQCHHKDPAQKLFVVNTRTLINYSWKKILLEAGKCQLLCANCHFIVENKEY